MPTDSPPGSKPLEVRWQLHSRAARPTVWAAFSDTDRLNRVLDMGLRFQMSVQPDGSVQRSGSMRRYGLTLTWRELPVQYDAPRALRIERHYDNGPAQTLVATLELTDRDGGTDIVYALQFTPRPLMAWLVQWETARLRKQFDPALQAVLAALAQDLPAPDRAPPPLDPRQVQTLQAAMAGIQPAAVAQALAHFLREAPLAEQDRMRPLALARHWRLPEQDVVLGCLHAVRAGLLTLSWDLLCPSCQLPAASRQRLAVASGQVHCPSCDVAYDGAFADSVAVVFRPAPGFRPFSVPIDCLSSPARTPHLVAQRVVAPGEEVEWTASLLTGLYRLRTWPPLDTASLAVRAALPSGPLTLRASASGLQPALLRAAPGVVRLVVRNTLTQPLRLVLERRWQQPFTLTAGQLLEMPGAVDLLPADSLPPNLGLTVQRGFVLAVQVLRGGLATEAAVAALLTGANALQHGPGLLVAVFAQLGAALDAASRLQGALFLAMAIGGGRVTILGAEGARVPAGQVVHDAVAAAKSAEPGEVVLAAGIDLDAELPERPNWLDQVVPWPRAAVGDDSMRLEFIAPKGGRLVLPTLNPAPLGPGDVVEGRFALQRLLGTGGFGFVFEAQDLKDGSPLVVKVLQACHAEDPDQAQRFYNEGRLAARLSGPHSVRILDYGHADDGRLFVAMERLQGRDLGEWLTQWGSLDPVRAAQLGMQALAGLAEAHGQGLVHRDIKPGNLFVCEQADGSERVKVIDFGIALDTTGRAVQPNELGSTIGTPLYMSPEQLRGIAVDARCDLYALAVVLYQCVSGQWPFRGDTTLAMVMDRFQGPPLPLTTRCPQPLPHGLAAAVMQALSETADLRFTDAEAMRAALQRVVTAAGDAAQWHDSWQRHREAIAARRPLAAATTDSDLAATLPLAQV